MESWTRGTLALAILAMACGAPAGTPDKLEVQLARANLMPEGGAVYFTVVNPGPEADRLLRVETGAARAAETHESVVENGVVRMVARPEGFEVPAEGELVLEPGGKHVMLISPQTADAGGKIALTLHFERAGAVQVQAEVSAPMDDGHEHHEGHEGQ